MRLKKKKAQVSRAVAPHPSIFWAWTRRLKENLNASKPSEHHPHPIMVGGGRGMTFDGNKNNIMKIDIRHRKCRMTTFCLFPICVCQNVTSCKIEKNKKRFLPCTVELYIPWSLTLDALSCDLRSRHASQNQPVRPEHSLVTAPKC